MNAVMVLVVMIGTIAVGTTIGTEYTRHVPVITVLHLSKKDL